MAETYCKNDREEENQRKQPERHQCIRKKEMDQENDIVKW